MKPLYDRYRLVKQILCRASTIPVIVSIQNLTPPPFPPLSALIVATSRRSRGRNPQLTLDSVPVVGPGDGRATGVLSTFQGPKSGFSSSVNPLPRCKGAQKRQIEFTGHNAMNRSEMMKYQFYQTTGDRINASLLH